MAIVCASPGPVFSLAAFCRVDFDNILVRHDADPDISPIRSFGNSIDRNRSVCVELVPGRHAALSKRDSQSGFEISLRRVGRCFYEQELELVAAFIGIPVEYLEKYQNPPTRLVSASPTEAELQHWLSLIGSAYPYIRADV